MAEEPANDKKRQVKNPETFRERAIKAGESDNQQRPGRIRRSAKLIVSPLKPVGRLLKRVFGLKPFRVIGRIIFPAYFRNSWRELRQVTWPNWRQSRQLTFAVLVFAAV